MKHNMYLPPGQVASAQGYCKSFEISASDGIGWGNAIDASDSAITGSNNAIGGGSSN
ncbi:hypothetical protein HY415_01790 [Candidatus Kaiserbacteria bacterium]|nr:hypothetical protein [Candidatus Kaiserbacteria bacterium]